MRESLFKRATGWLYALIILLLAALFFTNDFGLVDLRKTSVIIGVGVDFEEDGNMLLTAQLAVPRPAENGENTQYAVVTGSGSTVADALNDVNVKTGFYPKLVFCKLIVVGESCFDRDINAELNYFFLNEYSGLTPKIAACKGNAGDMFAMDLPFGESVTDSVDRLLSDEAQKSANVSTVNLNEFGQGYYSKSGAAYMPYIEFEGQPTEESQSVSSGGEQVEKQKQLESGVEFFCGKTAIFDKGKLVGIFDQREAFAFNLLNGRIRRTYVSCGEGEDAPTLSIRNCKGDISLKVENGVPILKLTFSAAAKIKDDKRTGKSQRGEGRTPDRVLRMGERTVKEFMESMYLYAYGRDCDVLGARDLLYKKQNRYYEGLKDNVTKVLTVVYDIKLRSTG